MAESRAFERVARELDSLIRQPPPWGVVGPLGNGLRELEARLVGPEKCCYEGGLFRLSISIPDRYPEEPPVVRFITPIYHPNVDSAGRICHHLLHTPPKGSWDPCLTISSLLLSIVLLMAEPNPDDGLRIQIAKELKESPELFNQKARDSTQIHAASLDVDAMPICRKRRRSSVVSSRKRSCSLATIEESDSECKDNCEEISSKLGVSGLRESTRRMDGIEGNNKERKVVRVSRPRRPRSQEKEFQFRPNTVNNPAIMEVVDAMEIEEMEPPLQKQRLV